jgi:flavin-dependent dehydrogenase
MKVDVAIIGGGPAGSTVATLLRKYNSGLSVLVLERDRFPRDHVGESQLPATGPILAEMGVWDKVEAAQFPIKLGGTYRWGRTDELWDFEFLPGVRFEVQDRPAKFRGLRRKTAFQVDRGRFDQILLDHAQSLGAEVRQETKVASVEVEGDRIRALTLADGSRIEADYVVDASGAESLVRRALSIEVEAPTALRNIAIWDYYRDAAWAVEIGREGTRIQVMSLGWGWVWFISIGLDRTSVGVVLPAAKYKELGLTPEEVLLKAVDEEPRIRRLLAGARREGRIQATKDWSYVADRIAGENWFLAGDACGFADPILSAGMTLAHTSARKVAYTILALQEGRHPPEWLRNEYDRGHRAQIRQHIQFADYWYSANGRFTDLQAYCSQIAAHAGLQLDAKDAFRWLATGGFASEDPGQARAVSFRLGGVKLITKLFSGEDSHWHIARVNVLHAELTGAVKEDFPVYENGGVEVGTRYRRGGLVLPLVQVNLVVWAAIARSSDLATILEYAVNRLVRDRLAEGPWEARALVIDTLEALLTEGWLRGSVDRRRPFVEITTPEESSAMHPNRDPAPAG